jgi:hypothetical protein
MNYLRIGVLAVITAAAFRLYKKKELAKPNVDELAIDLYITPGNATSEDIGELLLSMDKLNRACGGYGLNFEVKDSNTLTMTPA